MAQTIEETIKSQLKDNKNAHFMLIDGMSKLITHAVPRCQSSIFHVSGLKWKLIIRPASRNGTKDYLSFYLKISDRKSLTLNWEVKCSFTLTIVSHTKYVDDICKSFVGCYNSKEYIKGEENFISRTVFERYVVNDKVGFCAEINSVEPKFPVTRIPRAMGTASRLKVMEVPKKNSRFTWKITQFSSFDGVEHSSHEFTVGPRKWKLVMCPKGLGDGKGNSLSLYLNASDYVTNAPKDKTLAVYKMRVYDQLHRKHYETKHANWFRFNRSRGRNKFLPLTQLHDKQRGLLLNDEIYISVEFLLVSTTENL